MRKHLLVATTAVSLAAVAGAGVAGAAPSPKYSVTCSAATATTATWQRVRLAAISFEWFDAAGASTGVTNVSVSPSPPRGTTVNATPGSPATVTVTFQRADGSGADQVTMPCT